MIYYFFNYFNHLVGARLVQYISFRAIAAFIIALFFSFFFGRYFINKLNKKHISEEQRDIQIDPFNVTKRGVPTMGGVVIILSILVACFLIGKLENVYLKLLIITTLMMGAVGFVDDYIKTFKHNKDGLNGWWKISMQILLGLIVGLTLRYSPAAVMHENITTTMENNIVVTSKSAPVKSTRTTIPFFKYHNWNYADAFNWLGEPLKYKAGWVLFVFMTVFVTAAISNGANLNDGMDGMAAGNSAVIGVALLLLAYISGSTTWANYFDVMYIPESGEIVVFLAAFIGALIGFLWYNTYPAQIFMGDTGSLTIGGIIGVSAVIIHKELLLPLLCGIFFVESLSVILQTQIFRLTKKSGRPLRIFKRTPLHDHFRTSVEQVMQRTPNGRIFFKGPQRIEHENKITVRFIIVSILLAITTILTLKIR